MIRSTTCFAYGLALLLTCSEALAKEPATTPADLSQCPEGPRPLPQTLDSAVEYIVKGLDSESVEVLRRTERKDLIKFHLSWGMGIRNSLCMWGNDNLVRSACGGKSCHPDSASTKIMEAVWEKVRASSQGATPNTPLERTRGR